ncbi:NUDIX domain-containing protein [Nocardioides panacis]|uniref:NUDIX domain-containing protein n=1 Tax=Nocardioides panacis TaxID=2849501 RepID=A0A975SYW0_9ACTN|nr:NUDIX domain-containing protein [Nocardioides panacis]QWZ08515.1 NUDIX domain-containing protein [Nocardioides panacis]
MPSSPAADVLVVGAAVVRHGRVLATRRTHPPEAAGRWEFPGGKVEPGEELAAAVVREVREELGCGVVVTRVLDGAQPVKPGYTLRVAVAELVDGEPVPREHDLLRWLGPEELDVVPWLAPDLPFLAELRELLLDGHPLEGGNVGGAVRIGHTVRRPTGPWTPAVHRLLDRVRGLRAVPQVLGVDARGREVLTYLPGTIVDLDDAVLSDAQLEDLTRWTRELHDAVDGFVGEGPWRFFPVDGAHLVGHNDVAPYNVVFARDRVAGVFDWDLAGPTTRLFELAHLAWSGVPLFRETPPADVARRLELMAATYGGGVSARQILHTVPVLKQVGVDGIRAWIEAGDPAGVAQAAVGEPARTERAVAALAARVPAIEEELS